MINGLSTRHPPFYAAKLMQHFVQPGDTILSASSDYPLLSAYAARGASGALTLLARRRYPCPSSRPKAASKARVLGTKSIRRANAQASAAPCSRSMPLSSHSTERGPA